MLTACFIVGDWAHLPTVAVILARCLRRAPVAIWTDTPQEDVRRPSLKKWLRRKFLRWLLPKAGYRLRYRQKSPEVAPRRWEPDRSNLSTCPYLVDLHQPIRSQPESKYKEKSTRVA